MGVISFCAAASTGASELLPKKPWYAGMNAAASAAGTSGTFAETWSASMAFAQWVAGLT